MTAQTEKTPEKNTSKRKQTKPRKSVKKAKNAGKLLVPNIIEDIPESYKKYKYGIGKVVDLQQVLDAFNEVIEKYLKGEYKTFNLIKTSNTSAKVLGGEYPTLGDVLIGKISKAYFFEVINKKDNDNPLIEQLKAAYETFKEVQCSLLLKGGVSGTYNTSITALLLGAHFNIRNVEKVEVESNNTTTIKQADVIVKLDEIYKNEGERLRKQKQEMLERRAAIEALEEDEDEEE
ncbi:hypothetical protein [Gallibacterium anatis]|uniref:hypothetical protein n=1 Tax=Gallibacterium anatis TaxID=750 RepID=UPI000531CA3F|nr:hypothetical protein [Gallibacterium anatis]KGQ44481.1 hypothetical protein JP29_09035 [Gallibacterium anatis]